MKLSSYFTRQYSILPSLVVILCFMVSAACSKDTVLPQPENSNVVAPWQYELVWDTNHIRHPEENAVRRPVLEMEEGAPNR